MFWHVQACHADPTVSHPVIHVDPVWRAEIVTPVDGGWDHNVRDGSFSFLKQLWR